MSEERQLNSTLRWIMLLVIAFAIFIVGCAVGLIIRPFADTLTNGLQPKEVARVATLIGRILGLFELNSLILLLIFIAVFVFVISVMLVVWRVILNEDTSSDKSGHAEIFEPLTVTRKISPAMESVLKRKLRELMMERFVDSEIEILCSNIEENANIRSGIFYRVDYRDYTSDFRENRVYNLVEYLRQRKLLLFLIEEMINLNRSVEEDLREWIGLLRDDPVQFAPDQLERTKNPSD